MSDSSLQYFEILASISPVLQVKESCATLDFTHVAILDDCAGIYKLTNAKPFNLN
jgi:hypothetical protein